MKLRPIPCPCETCLRWSECNGVDAENCPLWQDWRERMDNREKLTAALGEEITDKDVLLARAQEHLAALNLPPVRAEITALDLGPMLEDKTESGLFEED